MGAGNLHPYSDPYWQFLKVLRLKVTHYGTVTKSSFLLRIGISIRAGALRVVVLQKIDKLSKTESSKRIVAHIRDLRLNFKYTLLKSRKVLSFLVIKDPKEDHRP